MYDLAIIGAGWAGFNAAIRAKELGLKACLIEKSHIGGTCLNLGCIPTKTLIQSAKVFTLNKKSHIFGIESTNPSLNFLKVQERKEKVIQQLRQGMQSMLKDIDYLNGDAQIVSTQQLKIGSQVIDSKFMLIASGSKPQELSSVKFDAKKILSSDEMLNLKEIPTSLLIIGGGVIGCEFASLFQALGTQVTIVEKMPQLLPGEDKEVARKLEGIFKKKGVKVNTNSDALNFNFSEYSLILLCVGRIPKTEGLGLDNIGVKLDRAKVVVDEDLRTNVNNIYAAGDCTGKIMLAHFAAYQGRLAVENIAKLSTARKVDAAAIPNCIFTDPEIASIGLNEETAAAKGFDINVNKFDFLGSGMARILEETEGFIKIISDKKTGEVLGASLIGPRATELIAILSLAKANQLKASSIKKTIFAHPTLSESIGEAFKNGL